MSAERRYNEEEIAAIFKQAAEAQETAQSQLTSREGLTLAELQQIGQEAGITPAFIVRAAAAVDQTATPSPPATLLGLPVSAARTVNIPGAFTDEDWDRLVVDLRHTFHATGKVRRDGSLRQWNNGNLRALVEPTESGHRLHLSTVKGNARSSFLGSLAALALGAVLLVSMALSGQLGTVDDTLIAALFAAGGLLLLAVTAYRLPRWAETRGRQMEAIAARAVQRASARADEPAGARDASLPRPAP